MPKTHLKLDVQTRNTVQNDSKTLPRLIPYLDESFGGFVRRLQTVFGHATCEKFSAVLHLEADPVDLLPVTRFREKLGQGACQKPIERFEVINRSEAGRSKQTVTESRRLTSRSLNCSKCNKTQSVKPMAISFSQIALRTSKYTVYTKDEANLRGECW